MDDQRKFPPKVYPFTSEELKKYNIYLPDFQPMSQAEREQADKLFDKVNIYSSVDEIVDVLHTDNDYL